MNKKQKIVIGVGLGLILLSGLFPYYGRNFGYGFIFNPPHNHWKSFETNETEGPPFRYGKIDFPRFYMQIITISLLTIGLIFLFADPKKNKNGK